MFAADLPVLIQDIQTEVCVYAKGVDPDQTAPKEQSDQGLYCLPIIVTA